MTFYSVFYIFILILSMMQGKKNKLFVQEAKFKGFKNPTHLPFTFNPKLPW